MAADVVVVMARHPTPGQIKTRLARHLGDAATCELYTAFLRDIHARLDNAAWQLVWAVTPADADLRPLLGSAVRQLPQRGGDLGQRMHRVFADLFQEGAARVVMIGADAPHLDAASLRAALTALETADAVFAPTRDGGYCLVGLTAPVDVFSSITMGTASVLRETLACAAERGLRVVRLAETFDLDEIDDVRELAAMIARGDVRLPHTRAALAALPSC